MTAAWRLKPTAAQMSRSEHLIKHGSRPRGTATAEALPTLSFSSSQPLAFKKVGSAIRWHDISNHPLHSSGSCKFPFLPRRCYIWHWTSGRWKVSMACLRSWAFRVHPGREPPTSTCGLYKPRSFKCRKLPSKLTSCLVCSADRPRMLCPGGGSVCNFQKKRRSEEACINLRSKSRLQ